jgi:hypothetical protein
MNPFKTLPAFLCPVLLLALGAPAQAQVQLTCSVPNTQVLQHEPLSVVVAIRNDSAQPIASGGADGFALSFDVTDPDGIRIHARGDAPTWVPASLPALAEVVFTNDLQMLFRLDKPGAVAISARLQVAGRTYTTTRSLVEIQPGSEVARRQTPAADGSLRTITLRTMNRAQRDRLFLRLDDESAGLCYGVFELGRHIRVGAPTLEIDSQQRVHVLHLSGPNQFTHSVYSLNGDRLAQQSVPGDISSVRLQPDAEQGYRISGAGATPTPGEPMVQPLPLRRGL